VIRNVCIHTANEQPLMCDLYELPSVDDAGLVCTNLRSMDGKRPVFIDAIASTFFFPYHVVRFLEIPEAEMASHRASGGAMPGAGRRITTAVLDAGDPAGYVEDHAFPGDDPATDADRGSLLPVPVGAPEAGPEDDADLELEIDEGFLQRIRDI
jgi:hypothetical protein